MGSTRAGRYTLVEQVGFRQAAELWRAYETGGDPAQPVLIERLPAGEAAGESGQHFVQRARRGLAVQHRHVTGVYEVGTTAPGDLFVVKEWVDGPSLLRLVAEANRRQERLPVWLPLYVGACVLEALSFAGRSAPNLAHGDVRSRNVFVTFEGVVKLIDFGVGARATRGPYDAKRDALEQAGYRAPGEVNGSPPSTALDLYAVAVVLWEALTQRRLYAGSTIEEVQRVVARGPDQPPSALTSGIPDPVDVLVMDALQVRPALRPATCEVFGDWIKALREEVSEEATAGPAALACWVQALFASSSRTGLAFFALPSSRAMVDTQPDAPFADVSVLPDRSAEYMAIRDLWGPPQGSKVFLRGPGNVSRGPRTPLEALRLLTELTGQDAPSLIEVSVDQQRWLSAAEVARLLDEAVVDEEDSALTGEVVGSLSTHSVTRAFAEVARTGCSGQLVFVRRDSLANLRYAFDVDAGNLMACASNRHLLFGLRALPFDGVVPGDFSAAVGRMLQMGRPFTDLAGQSTLDWLTDVRGEGLRRSLIEVLSWPKTRFAFRVGVPAAPGRAEPLPILGALPGAVEVALGVQALLDRLEPYLREPMIRTPRYRQEVAEARLSTEDRRRLQRLGDGRSLKVSWAMSSSLRDERAMVRLSYLAVELEWLVAESRGS